MAARSQRTVSDNLMMDFKTRMMERALSLARKGIGKTSPNPAVGCVIVQGGTVVGEGWHRKAGTPHAEIHALRQAGERARNADVYVTLEPCSHFGKTPPCAEALVKAGVARVFAGMIDPNPRVSGKGAAILQSAGIDVRIGLMEKECTRVNEAFIKHAITGRPFVILKSALTLDGKTATATGHSKWITSDKSRRYVHKLRSAVDAIMVGVGTVIADDPQLTCRIHGGRKDPVRIVVDSRLRIPRDAKILHQESDAGTLVATIMQDSAILDEFRKPGTAEVIQCREKSGRVDLDDLMKKLGMLGIQSVLLEGGRELAGEMLRLGLIDKFLLFFAPKLVGGEDGLGLFAGKGVESMTEAKKLKDIKISRFGEDFMLEGYPEKSCLPV
jgi:diaminohydroxyphosphoribosylaminopyrimidine deaminase/5-amino-6-(5-phosphoribosylamino)uracil reductase